MKFWGTFAFACVLMRGASFLEAQGQESAAEYRRQAQELLVQGKYQQARDAAGQALRLDPRSPEAERLVGSAEFALGDLAAAQRHLQRALDLQPGLIAARRTLGQTYIKQKRLGDARREFELILTSQPEDLVSLYGAGLVYLLSNQPAHALKDFENVLKLKPNDPDVLAGILQAHLKLKQKAQAAETLAKLDARLGERDPRRLQLAALLVSEGAYELAIEEFERLSKSQPDSYEVNYNLALAYHRAGKEGEASALLESLIARNENPELENLLGDVEESLGNQGRALAAFHRAAELEPPNEDYRYDYAQALASQWALDQALEAFAAGTKDFPRSVKMWLGWGATYYLAGRYAEAAQTLLRAAQIAPQAPEVYYLLGRAYDASGSLQKTIAGHFSRYLSTDAQDPWAHYFYGRILAARSREASSADLDEAQHHLERAIALDSNLAEAHMELGNVLEMRGQLEPARKELERAAQLDPRSSAAYYRLVQVYRKLGKPDLAQKAGEKFQQLKAQERANLDREQIQGFLQRVKR